MWESSKLRFYIDVQNNWIPKSSSSAIFYKILVCHVLESDIFDESLFRFFSVLQKWFPTGTLGLRLFGPLPRFYLNLYGTIQQSISLQRATFNHKDLDP